MDAVAPFAMCFSPLAAERSTVDGECVTGAAGTGGWRYFRVGAVARAFTRETTTPKYALAIIDGWMHANRVASSSIASLASALRHSSRCRPDCFGGDGRGGEYANYVDEAKAQTAQLFARFGYKENAARSLRARRGTNACRSARMECHERDKTRCTPALAQHDARINY